MNGFLFNGGENHTLIAQVSGIYFLSYSLSMTSASGADYISTIGVNGAETNETLAHVTAPSGGAINVLASSGILRINKDDTITLMIRQTNSPQKDPTYFAATVNAFKIGI